MLETLAAGVATWTAIAFGAPALFGALASRAPARLRDPSTVQGRLRDRLVEQGAAIAPTSRELGDLTRTWVEAFSARGGGLRWVLMRLCAPSVLARLALARLLARRVVVQDRSETGSALLTLRLAGDGAWWLADLAAWPRRGGHAPRLLERVLAAADASGTTVRLEASNRALAERYYTALGFTCDDATAASPRMTRRPRLDNRHESVRRGSDLALRGMSR